MPQRDDKAIPKELLIFILAGGKSSRMGREKWRLPLGNRSFLERITETARELGAPVQAIFEDVQPGLGPMGGVLTAFERFRFKRALFLSCDMPLVSEAVLRRVAEQAGSGEAVFMTENGRAGFPFLLPRAAEKKVKAQIAAGAYALGQLAEATGAVRLDAERTETEALLNVNTPEEYRRVQRIWAERQRSDAVLEVRRLRIRRGSTDLISDLSWKVQRGEHWVILGPNGCGKTSLFNALLGYVTPTRGDVFVLGEEYGNSDWPELRKKVGLVSSSVRQMIPDHEPAWITVASGKYAMIDFWGTPKPGDRREATRILTAVEAERLAERPWACLSQGERQRVLIGRALMARPALLVLDEPCAGLDPAAREHFLWFLDRLASGRNAPSLVLVTHHVEEIMPFFTHVFLMKAGRMLAEGAVRELLHSKRLSETFGTPIRLKKNGGRYALEVQVNSDLIA